MGSLGEQRERPPARLQRWSHRSDKLEDPVDALFGTQLGAAAAPTLTRRSPTAKHPSAKKERRDHALISDLYEGGDATELIKRAAAIVAGGFRLIVLLALSDDSAPACHDGNAAALAALGAPSSPAPPSSSHP